MVLTIFGLFGLLMAGYFRLLLASLVGIAVGCVVGNHVGYYYGRSTILDERLRKLNQKPLDTPAARD